MNSWINPTNNGAPPQTSTAAIDEAAFFVTRHEIAYTSASVAAAAQRLSASNARSTSPVMPVNGTKN